MHINFSPSVFLPSTPFYFLPVPSGRSHMRARKRACREYGEVYPPHRRGVFSPRTYAIGSASEEDRILTRRELSNVTIVRVELLCGAQSVTVKILCDQKVTCEVNNCLSNKTNTLANNGNWQINYIARLYLLLKYNFLGKSSIIYFSKIESHFISGIFNKS